MPEDRLVPAASPVQKLDGRPGERMDTGMGTHRLYGDLAWLWPIISPPEDYVDESEAFAELLNASGAPEMGSLLHLGCGAGHNDHTFLGHYQVTGIDISEPMLDHARRLNPTARYERGDIRTMRLNREFSAVVALDSVNYMLTEEDLRAVFITAAAHLPIGGVFLTYVEHNPENFEQNKTVGSAHASGDLEVTFVENLYARDPASGQLEALFLYLIRKDGVLTIETDVSRCGLFPFDTWVRLLLEAGFDVRQFEYQWEEGSLPVLVGVKVR